MDSAPETLAGISVDAVREQLAQLGHDDVSDEVIREFLKQLTADAAFLEEPAVPPRAAPAPARPRRAARTTASAAKARAASAEGASARETAREAPEPMRVPTSPRRTPRTEEPKNRRTVVAPAPRGAARRGAVARGADGAPIPVAASVLSPRTPSAASSTPRRDASTPIRSTFGSAPRFARDPLGPGPAGAARPRSARRSSPTRTRVVAASERGAFRANARIDSEPVIRDPKSVIRAAIPVARGATPGQYRVTDRVARAARYSDAWREDAFLRNAELRTDARARAAVVPRRPQNFAAAFARAQARSDANVERAKREARAARGEKLSREDWERHFELSRRARVKLTDAGNARDEGRGFRKKTSPSPLRGGTTRESKPRGRLSREFTPPCDNRRDDVRWEVRRRMAAPPVLSR